LFLNLQLLVVLDGCAFLSNLRELFTVLQLDVYPTDPESSDLMVWQF